MDLVVRSLIVGDLDADLDSYPQADFIRKEKASRRIRTAATRRAFSRRRGQRQQSSAGLGRRLGKDPPSTSACP